MRNAEWDDGMSRRPRNRDGARGMRGETTGTERDDVPDVWTFQRLNVLAFERLHVGHEPSLHGIGRNLRPIRNLELGEDVSDVALDGVDGDVQFLRDLGVAGALGEQCPFQRSTAIAYAADTRH